MGLSIYARDLEIKRAFRKLALQFHPDKNSSANAESIFKEINEAYEVLSDPQRKLVYDQQLVGIEPEIVPAHKPHRDPRYRRKASGTYRGPSRKKELLDADDCFLVNWKGRCLQCVSASTILSALPGNRRPEFRRCAAPRLPPVEFHGPPLAAIEYSLLKSIPTSVSGANC